ncbi:MAG: DUF885 domain-containing protein [Acidobacteria bacterium]|nr:DUF885 domain-containing protein [Acidobacteriota bacterium]
MAATDANAQFQSTVEDILRETWDFYPDLAAGLGLHDYDGRLPDISPMALARRAREVEDAVASLRRMDAGSLDRQNGFDRRLLTLALKKERFELSELKPHETNPMEMLDHIELSNYVKRDYAPLEERVKSLTQALEGVPTFLKTLQDSLSDGLARPVLDASIEAYEGLVSFYDNDIPNALAELGDSELKGALDIARATASRAVTEFVRHMNHLRQNASGDFALGARKFRKLLALGEMVNAPLERLLGVGLEDLARNRARLKQIASEVSARRTVQEVMQEIAADHPEADSLIPTARDMLEEIRSFLIERDIVTVPSEVRCQTMETPSFMRWAFAAMDMPGPFEMKATEAFYYVTPVEEEWTDEEKEQWLSSFNYASLQNISVHEAYPGHYVHYLHTRAAPSKISQVCGAYSFWEGWGHYAEEMMVEEGFATEPRMVLGQLADALLRDCRYVCAIRMHTQGMSVEEAKRFFMENAYVEEVLARQQTVRGTFDPGYLLYTLGKLYIKQMREDYRKKVGDQFTLKAFHDALLQYGSPPLPMVRARLLGD